MALIVSGKIEAYDWLAKGRVTSIEITYFPANVRFTLDVNEGGSSCTIIWDGSTALGSSANKQVDNVKAVYAALLSAKASGQPISVYGLNPVSGLCAGQFIYTEI